MSSNSSRLESLQILRGVAAWMVVFHHIVQSYFVGRIENPFWDFFDKYGSFGADIFFVLSGFVMGLVSKKYQKSGIVFGINRVFRVIPVYWFYTLLLVVSIIVLPSGIYLTGWKNYSLIKSLFFIPNLNPNGLGYFPTLYVGWTLIYEMFFYVVFTIVLMMNMPKPAIACAFILIVIAYFYRGINFLGNGALMLLEFSIGILIYEYQETIKRNNNFARRVFPIAIFPVIAFASFFIDVNLIRYLIAGLIVYTFIIFEDLFAKDMKILQFLKALGDYSYSTYLSHVVIIGWFYYIFGRANHSSVLDFLAVLCILLTVLVVSSYSYQLIETNEYISKIKYMTADVLTRKSM